MKQHCNYGIVQKWPWYKALTTTTKTTTINGAANDTDDDDDDDGDNGNNNNKITTILAKIKLVLDLWIIFKKPSTSIGNQNHGRNERM